MQKRWESFALFSRRSCAALCLPCCGLCLLPSIVGIVSSGVQWEQANKGGECAFAMPDVMMEVKYWWANFKWELCVIIRGLKLKEWLLQAAQFFQREPGFEDWKAPWSIRGQCCVLTAHTESSWSFVVGAVREGKEKEMVQTWQLQLLKQRGKSSWNVEKYWIAVWVERVGLPLLGAKL